MRMIGAFACGAASVAGAGLCVAAALAFTDPEFLATAEVILLAHIPVMLVEGCVTALAASFVAKARPELLGGVFS